MKYTESPEIGGEVHEWTEIQGFPGYLINRLGEIYNERTKSIMRTSPSIHGHLKIGLVDYETGRRHTMGVAKLVANTFLDTPENALFDSIIYLDGGIDNVTAANLAWRPCWHAWSYMHQFKEPLQAHYRNVPVEENVAEEDELSYFFYDSIIEAATTRGVLFRDIWQSICHGSPVFPQGAVYYSTA